MMAIEFGRRIAEKREQRGLSQVKLAEMAGLHQFGVAKLEQGLRAPNLTTVIMLAKALRVSPGTLVVGLPAPRPRARPTPRAKKSKRTTK